MKSALPAQRPDRRFDPFAFPSETRDRFRMLLLAALVAALNSGFLVYQRMYGAADIKAHERFSGRIARVVGVRDMRELDRAEVAALGKRLSPLVRERIRELAPRLLLRTFCPTLFLLLVATWIYLDHPARFRRRLQARPLEAAEAPRVVDYLKRCSEGLGIPALDLQYRPGPGNQAQTFGLRGREVLLFHGPPWLLDRAWGDTARALVLHEIGHIVNGDAQDREKSKAIWAALLFLLAFELCILGGFILLDARMAAAREGSLLSLAWRFGGLLLVVRLTWAGLVRVRELYADRRVSSWGLEGALDRLLGLPHRGRQRRLGAVLDRLLRPHPSNRTRREVLADPDRLFRVPLDLPFVTGVLFAILWLNLFLPAAEVFSVISLTAGELFRGSSGDWEKPRLLAGTVVLNLGVPFLFFSLVLGLIAYLLTGTLGAQVQREAIADLAASGPAKWGYGGLWRPALLFVAGVAAGFALAPLNPGLTFQPGLLALWLLGLAGLAWLWLAYIRALARFTIGLHAGKDIPRKMWRMSIWSSVALLTVLCWPAAFALFVQSISRAASSVKTLPGDAREQLAFLAMTGAMMALLAIFLYVIWAVVSLVAVAFRLRYGANRCSCGDRTVRGFAVGRSCRICGCPLAVWAYEQPALDPAG